MRVLLSGYYGFGNLGDEAILSALSAGLIERGHEVEVLSADPAATRSVHGVDACRRVTGLPLALARSDALVSGGGGLLQDSSSRRSLLYYLGVLRAARATRLRTVVYGQSIGPLSPRGSQAVGRVLAGLPVAVRDQASVSLLGRWDIAAVQVADAALALPRPEATGGDGLLLVPRADVPGAHEALLRLAREASSSGTAVSVAALQPGPDEADADAIAAAIGPVRRLHFATPDDATRACARADAVASVRLHGLIFAARAGTPHVGVAYDPKVRGFLAESGGEAVDAPVAADALVAAWRSGRFHRPREENRGDALAAEAEAGLSWLDAALRRDRA